MKHVLLLGASAFVMSLTACTNNNDVLSDPALIEARKWITVMHSRSGTIAEKVEAMWQVLSPSVFDEILAPSGLDKSDPKREQQAKAKIKAHLEKGSFGEKHCDNPSPRFHDNVKQEGKYLFMDMDTMCGEKPLRTVTLVLYKQGERWYVLRTDPKASYVNPGDPPLKAAEQK